MTGFMDNTELRRVHRAAGNLLSGSVPDVILSASAGLDRVGLFGGQRVADLPVETAAIIATPR